MSPNRTDFWYTLYCACGSASLIGECGASYHEISLSQSSFVRVPRKTTKTIYGSSNPHLSEPDISQNAIRQYRTVNIPCYASTRYRMAKIQGHTQESEGSFGLRAANFMTALFPSASSIRQVRTGHRTARAWKDTSGVAAAEDLEVRTARCQNRASHETKNVSVDIADSRRCTAERT